jgi:hypothetical protein
MGALVLAVLIPGDWAAGLSPVGWLFREFRFVEVLVMPPSPWLPVRVRPEGPAGRTGPYRPQ